RRFDDALGGVRPTIEAFTGTAPSDHADRTTDFAYDGDGHLVGLTAWLTAAAYQKPVWLYGVTTAGGSGVNSNDLLREVWHPDKVSGAASSAERDRYTVNALGEVVTAQDRNGTVHTFSYDVVGRPIADTVTTLGSGVDGLVRRLGPHPDPPRRPHPL